MGFGKKYIIGSFNVNGLSRSTATRYRSSRIADIIRQERMDLLAMQEVMDPDALKPVISALGGGWDMVFLQSRPKSGMLDVDHDPRGEGYAFLWDTRRLRKLHIDLLSGEEDTWEPQVYWKYHTNGAEHTLIRDPVLGRFTPCDLGGGNFELRVLCNHIRYNGIDETRDHFFWPKRQQEFNVLMKTILPRVEDSVYGSQMPSYTILLGDYNMNLQRIWTKKPWIEVPSDGMIVGDKRIVTVQDQLTTLKKPKNSGDRTSGYQDNFDHFSYNVRRLSALQPACRRVDVVGSGTYPIYYGDYDRYREEISDHIPIVLEINPK